MSTEPRTIDLPHGEGQAAIIIPSGRPADAPSVPLPRAQSHGDDAPATSAPPEASGAQEREEGPWCAACHGWAQEFEDLCLNCAVEKYGSLHVATEREVHEKAENTLKLTADLAVSFEHTAKEAIDVLADALGTDPYWRAGLDVVAPAKLVVGMLYESRAAREQAEARVAELESQLRTEREQAQEQIAALTLEVARLSTAASAVHASAMQARRAMTEVEERAANAALPWRRRETCSPEVAEVFRAAVRGDELRRTR